MKTHHRFRHRTLTRLGKAVAGVALALPLMVAALPASAEGTLNVYNWGDYINPEVLQRFSEEYDVEVNLDTYGSNEEMLAKIQAGATGYDIVFPSVHMHDIMHKLGLLWKSNINEHPLFKNIDRDFLRAKTDPNGEWCLPYAWGTVGIFFNKNLVPVPRSRAGRTFSPYPTSTARTSSCSVTCAK